MSPFLAPIDAISAFLETGGLVLWSLLLVCVVLWTLIIERYWFFRRIYPYRTQEWVEDWQARDERRSWFAHRIREAVISQANAQLKGTLPMINLLIAVCPLFGLLGTVTGMIAVFDVMALKGTSDARAMASGVSQATVPTMAGMVVALSGLYFATRFKQIVKRETQRLADELKFT